MAPVTRTMSRHCYVLTCMLQHPHSPGQVAYTSRVHCFTGSFITRNVCLLGMGFVLRAIHLSIVLRLAQVGPLQGPLPPLVAQDACFTHWRCFPHLFCDSHKEGKLRCSVAQRITFFEFQMICHHLRDKCKTVRNLGLGTFIDSFPLSIV